MSATSSRIARVVARNRRLADIKSRVEDPELVERRRDEIVRAAAELFSRNGYHRTTMQEVADEAGVSVGLLYNYVKDKEDTLFLVIENVLLSYMREIPTAIEAATDPLERFCAAVRAYCQVVGANPYGTMLAYRETYSLGKPRREIIKQMEVETNRLIAEPLQACVERGLFRPIRIDLAVYRIVLLAHGWALKRWALAPVVTLEEYAEEGIELFLRALFTPKGLRHYRRVVTPKA